MIGMIQALLFFFLSTSGWTAQVQIQTRSPHGCEIATGGFNADRLLRTVGQRANAFFNDPADQKIKESRRDARAMIALTQPGDIVRLVRHLSSLDASQEREAAQLSFGLSVLFPRHKVPFTLALLGAIETARLNNFHIKPQPRAHIVGHLANALAQNEVDIPLRLQALRALAHEPTFVAEFAAQPNGGQWLLSGLRSLKAAGASLTARDYQLAIDLAQAWTAQHGAGRTNSALDQGQEARLAQDLSDILPQMRPLH